MSGGLKTGCRHPGCPDIVEGDYCGDHKSDRRSNDRRESSAKRGYDAKWRKLRDQYLAVTDYCEDPYGRHGTQPPRATEVDHITPISEGGVRLDPRNCQALCRGCHAKKTREDQQND